MRNDERFRKPTPDLVYDARGLFCPIPIIRAAERIATMKAGEVLEVISDDPGIREDVHAWCVSTGHRLLRLHQDGRDIMALVQKTGKG